MAKYLIDVNLPYYFSLWKGKDFVHQRDINDEWDDEQIWNYAKENNLIIISKDSDFSNKILLHTPPPRGSSYSFRKHEDETVFQDYHKVLGGSRTAY